MWGYLLDTDSMQFGFKAGVSTTQCSWLVQEVATHFMRRGTALNACLLDCSKAFDKCRFDKLFKKLLSKGLPPIVVRVLIFAYEEQSAFVKLSGMKSTLFKITNGTRQGSVLSPIIFSLYLDDLLKQLRKLGLGCHIGGMWYGACCYADDMILLAPNRDVLQQMLNVCEEYALSHNLVFSTDPCPVKSKTKCILFCGKVRNPKYPEPVILNSEELPWVRSADHLGHLLEQSLTMESDCNRARAKYISKSVQIRNEMSAVNPDITMKVIQTYCHDAYGSMLWDLGSPEAESFYKCWNTNVKLVYGIPRNTFTYLIEGYFAKHMSSLRNQIFVRYSGFYRSLLSSPSTEVQLLARLASRDPRSPTFANLRLLKKKTNIDRPYLFSSTRIKLALPNQCVPVAETWRLGLLDKLFVVRSEYLARMEDSVKIVAMIENLCST